ncbi:MAG TPA: filamentous hemagglutinin N-terminal domain-containing protein, partial [Nitrospiraceae bacterium]|nr:filamentous hemagglutinin N-terminal domain-containing protein [Nitrospiraceae bacterium]
MDKRKPQSRHADSMRQAFLSALLPTLVLFLIAPFVGNAEAVTNITSSGLGTEVPLQPPSDGVYNITHGTRPGGGPNLFHSFGDFSIGQGDIANFLNDSGLTTTNVIGRVTDGHMSNIDGIIQTTGFGNANLFLVNPSGIVFGPHGSFNVGGSVSFATAQYLRLFDGLNSANLYANPANDGLANSVFAMAPVVDFGFLSPAAYGFLTVPDPSATITVRGSALSVLPDQSISLVGGNISIQAGMLEDGTIQAASLHAPGGQINLVSVASPGEVLVPSFQTGPNINGASFTTMGTVTLKEGATLDVSGQLDESGAPIGNGNSGTVFVRGGQFVMEDAATILANTVGAVDGARTAVDIQVSHDVALSNGSNIVTKASGSGRGGDVHVTADSLTLENGSSIFTVSRDFTVRSERPVVGGDLFLNVETLRLLGGSSGGSQIGSLSGGSDLDGDGVVDVTGVGGNITVQGTTHGANSAADSVVFSGGSSITSDASAESGDGGRISIRANSLDLSGHDTNDVVSTISSSTAGTGHGGDIVVAVQRLRVIDGATITSGTSSTEGSAGAGGTVTVQGLERPGTMASSVLLSGPNTGIVSDSGLGVPGEITVNAETLTITNGAAIAAGTSTSTGPAGNVKVTADSVVISADGRIFSRSFDQNSGTVTIKASELTLDKGSIVTITESAGRGGNVDLQVVGTVSLTNGARINSQSGSEEAPFSTGRAGDITMTVGSLTLANHAEITSSSKGTEVGAGNAGHVTITSSGSFTSNASTIATSAENARGGDINVTAQSVALSNGSVMSASSRSPLLPDGGGNAGNITINSALNVVMQNSSVTTEASHASGGDIEIRAPDAVMIQLVNSQVSTS